MVVIPLSDLPRSAVDSAGRLLPESEAEHRTRLAELARVLAEIDALTDETDTDETWAEVFRGIDAGRPHRPLFEGQY
jgi:hypothetical protein